MAGNKLFIVFQFLRDYDQLLLYEYEWMYNTLNCFMAIFYVYLS